MESSLSICKCGKTLTYAYVQVNSSEAFLFTALRDKATWNKFAYRKGRRVDNTGVYYFLRKYHEWFELLRVMLLRWFFCLRYFFQWSIRRNIFYRCTCSTNLAYIRLLNLSIFLHQPVLYLFPSYFCSSLVFSYSNLFLEWCVGTK